MIPADAPSILNFVGRGSGHGQKTVMIASTRGSQDEKLAAMSEEDRREVVISEVRKILPKFPESPSITKMFRWNRAVNLESPGQFTAIQEMLKFRRRC
jgi:monoamine oxidase